MKYLLIITLFLSSLYSQTIKDISNVIGIRENQLIGYGLVVGLPGTGDKSKFTMQSLQNLLRNSYIKIPAGSINSKNIAAVMVTADLPPFSRQGDKIKVKVSTIGDAKSVDNGELLITQLKGVDGNVYALAQGTIISNENNKTTGFIYEGLLDFEVQRNSISTMPELAFKVMMNVGNPDRAFDFAQIPNEGVGLARLEFIINRMIGVHPKALLNIDSLPQETAQAVKERMAGYNSPVEFYINKLIEGISTLAVAFRNKPVIVRMSDFKSNEYANLIGGKLYEPSEENPMLGFRGASRYVSDNFRDCFELECRALKYVRDDMGLTNVKIMIPFVRTTGEAKQVIELLEKNGLKRGENGLEIIMMCELPTNAILADEFLQYFDGFSIGSNDLTQLTLGLDRDSGIVSHLFDERDPAVKKLLGMAIQACRDAGKYVGICGQGPSDHPDLAYWLMEQGISSVSLNPDSVLDTWFFLADDNNKS